MKFTEEQLKKINTAKSAEELMALAKAEGIEMSEEEIKAKFAEMHKEGEIADNELNNVAGGCGVSETTIDQRIGQYVKITETGEYGVIEDYFYTQYRTFFKVKLVDSGTSVNVRYENVEFVSVGAISW